MAPVNLATTHHTHHSAATTQPSIAPGHWLPQLARCLARCLWLVRHSSAKPALVSAQRPCSALRACKERPQRWPGRRLPRLLPTRQRAATPGSHGIRLRTRTTKIQTPSQFLLASTSLASATSIRECDLGSRNRGDMGGDFVFMGTLDVRDIIASACPRVQLTRAVAIVGASSQSKPGRDLRALDSAVVVCEMLSWWFALRSTDAMSWPMCPSRYVYVYRIAREISSLCSLFVSSAPPLSPPSSFLFTPHHHHLLLLP